MLEAQRLTEKRREEEAFYHMQQTEETVRLTCTAKANAHSVIKKDNISMTVDRKKRKQLIVPDEIANA